MGQRRYPPKSRLFRGNFPFKVRKHGQQQQLHLQCKVCWILYKMVVTYAYNHPYNLHLKSVSLLQSIFTSLFHLYLFTKSCLQSPITLSSSILQWFCTPLFLHTTSPTIYTKKYFPTSAIEPIQGVSRDQEASKYCEDWHCFKFSPSSWK